MVTMWIISPNIFKFIINKILNKGHIVIATVMISKIALIQRGRHVTSDTSHNSDGNFDNVFKPNLTFFYFYNLWGVCVVGFNRKCTNSSSL